MQVLAGHGFATESVMSFRWRESIVAPISGAPQTSAEKLGQEMLDREVKRRRLAKPTDSQLDSAAHAISLPKSLLHTSSSRFYHHLNPEPRRARATGGQGPA